MVQSHLPPFRNVGNFVHHTFAYVFRKTLKAGGPFYLVSMPGKISKKEVKYPTQGEMCNVRKWTHLFERRTTLKPTDNNDLQVDRGHLMAEEERCCHLTAPGPSR